MPGFSGDALGSIVWADNVDFSGNHPETSSMTTNAQLLIGSTTAPHIKVGNLTSPDGSVIIGYSSPNITLQSVGGGGSATNLGMQIGTSPVVPFGATITLNGAVVAAGTNPIRSDGTGPNTATIEVQRTQAIAATDATRIGLAAFNSAQFTVDGNGFVSATGTVPVQVTGNTGTATPAAGNLNLFAAATAPGTSPASTTAAGSTITVNVQRSQAVAASDATRVGLSNFNSAQFTVDANGFVSTSGTGLANTITGQSGGALSPAAGNWNIFGASTAAGTSPVVTSGAGSTLTMNVQKAQAIAATDPTKVGLANFNSAQFTVDANGFVSTSGSGVITTLTPDLDFDGTAGTPVAPQAGTINALGYAIGASLTRITDTINSTGASTGNFQIEDRTWQTQYVVDASTTVGTRGTYATIALAIAAAVADGASSSAFKNIYIRPGIYTESFSMADGINLFGLPGMNDDFGVTIRGTIIVNITGICSFNNLVFDNTAVGGVNINAQTGPTTSTININDCTIIGASGINGNNAGCTVNINGGFFNNISAVSAFMGGTFKAFNCRNNRLTNTGGSSNNVSFTTIETINLINCNWNEGLTYTASVSSTIYGSRIDLTGIVSAIPLAIAGAGVHNVTNCQIISNGTAAAINNSVATTISSCSLTSGNFSNIIAGTGTTTYSDISVFGVASGTLTASAGTSVLGKQAVGAEFVELPAGNLTVKANHRFVGVDTTATRTITLPATKVIGQRHTIADITGSAGTNNITVSGNGSNILGTTSAASFVMTVDGEAIDVVWVGTNWKVC